MSDPGLTSQLPTGPFCMTTESIISPELITVLFALIDKALSGLMGTYL